MVDNVYTVRGVVYSFMNRKGIQGTDQYERLELLAFELVRYLNMNFDNSISTKYLTLKNGIAKLPKDYINWMAVSVDCGGHLITLALNPRLISAEVNNVDCELEFADPQVISQNGRYNYTFEYWNGSEIQTMYSAGSGFRTPHFNIDLENKTLVVTDKVDASQVVLQYVGMTSLCGDTMINPLYHEALIAGLDYRTTQYDDRRANLVPMKKLEFKQQVETAIAKEGPDVMSIYNLILQGNHRGIKR